MVIKVEGINDNLILEETCKKNFFNNTLYPIWSIQNSSIEINFKNRAFGSKSILLHKGYEIWGPMDDQFVICTVPLKYKEV